MAIYDKSMTIVKYYVSHTDIHTQYLTIPVLAVSAIRLSSSAGNSSALSLMHPYEGRGKGGDRDCTKQYMVYDGGL